MTMTTWSEKEIELACKHENPNWDGKSFDYGCSCYQSALKAYKSLLSDGHSGASFGFTRNILVRLMNGLPLTPIAEKDFENGNQYENDDHSMVTQCPRMGSLFQTKHTDGTITYSDIERAVAYHVSKDYGVGYGRITKLVDEMYPITMPYWPPAEKYKVFFDEFLADPKNGDFDTIAALYLITPKGERVEINRFWTEKDGEMVEIDKKEYEKLSKNRINK